MNIDKLIFENYLDQIILEDSSIIYESGMKKKIKLVGKITLVISSVTLLVLVAKKIKKYIENNKDKKQVELVINSLNKIKMKLLKLKVRAKKVEKVNESDRSSDIKLNNIHNTKSLLAQMSLDSTFVRDEKLKKVETEEELKKINSEFEFIANELDKAYNKVYDLYLSYPDITKEESEWFKNTMRDVKNYMNGRE